MTLDGPAVQLADALAGRLNDLGIPAVRAWVPVLDPRHLASVRVWVIPATHEIELQNRAQNRHRVGVAILVAKQVTKPSDLAEVDAVALLVERIKRLWDGTGEDGEGSLRREKLAGMSWLGTIQNSPLYDHDQLYHDSRFFSQISVTYGGTF